MGKKVMDPFLHTLTLFLVLYPVAVFNANCTGDILNAE